MLNIFLMLCNNTNKEYGMVLNGIIRIVKVTRT